MTRVLSRRPCPQVQQSIELITQGRLELVPADLDLTRAVTADLTRALRLVRVRRWLLQRAIRRVEAIRQRVHD